jgi:hypothetical protein
VRRLNRRGVVNEKVIRKWCSDPHRPRVMRSCSQGQRRSVDRGTCRPGIQPRKKLPPGRRRCKEKRKAPWRHYGEELENNLQDLSERLKRGAYRAKPVRRVFIPKADGRQRPLGVTALEDKIVQRAAVEVLSAIYETDFLGFSYGFRPGRSQHQALDALYTGLLTRKVNWVLDLDIKGFFDGLSHEWLVKFVERRLITRWLPPPTVCHPYPLRRMGVIT